MSIISQWSVPVIVSTIILWGFLKGVNVFDSFITGAKESLGVATKILPALVALITAVGIFRASGALDMLTVAISPLTSFFGIPSEVVPLALLRPISGSGAMIIFNDILAEMGPDSFAGRVASVMQGSTETTFYTIAVYFGAVSISKTRYTVIASLAADISGFILSAITVRLVFGVLGGI